MCPKVCVVVRFSLREAKGNRISESRQGIKWPLLRIVIIIIINIMTIMTITILMVVSTTFCFLILLFPRWIRCAMDTILTHRSETQLGLAYSCTCTEYLCTSMCISALCVEQCIFLTLQCFADCAPEYINVARKCTSLCAKSSLSSGQACMLVADV